MGLRSCSPDRAGSGLTDGAHFSLAPSSRTAYATRGADSGGRQRGGGRLETIGARRTSIVQQATGRGLFAAGWVLSGLLAATAAQAATVKDVRSKMGSRFEVTAVHDQETVARQAVEAAWAEIDRVEELISSWRDDSETAAVNRNAGVRPVRVSPELFRLIRRAVKVSGLTAGAFDITFAGVGDLWDFRSAEPAVPNDERIAAALRHVGYGKIVLDEERGTVFLDDPGARIGFGAIGKGYAANRAVFVMKDRGVRGGLVSAGGDLVAFGRREDGEPWNIAIAHPRDRDRVLARIPLTEQAVVTSGDYEQYFIRDGRRYSHIIDPRTGWPASGLQAVTVVCPDAELADALATAAFVMGPEEGFALIERMEGVEALFVTEHGEVRATSGVASHLSDRNNPGS